MSLENTFSLKKISLILFLSLSIFLFSLPSAFAYGIYEYGLPSNNAGNAPIYSITNSLNITINKNYMHYAENVPGGITLDKENADIPGVNLSLEGIPNPKIPVWYEINYSNYNGNSTYTGGTQSTQSTYGSFAPAPTPTTTPTQTTTPTTTTPPSPPSISTNSIHLENTDHIGYINYGIRAGYAFILDNSKLAIIPNAGFEWMNWNRDLEPVPSLGIGGYTEHYRFGRFLAGIKAYYLITERLWIEGEGYYTHGVDNSMDTNTFVPRAYEVNSSGDIINMAGNYERQSFELGDKSGFLFGAKIGCAAYKSQSVSISPYISVNYEQFGVNKSNSIAIYSIPAYLSNGNLYGYAKYTIDEPQSQTNEFIIGFGIKVGF